jgi:hypothetical protein
MEWDSGKLNAIVDRDKDPCWAEPVEMMFNKLMYGTPRKSNASGQTPAAEREDV